MIGREDELTAISKFLGEAVPIVVRGQHGSGKTALLDALSPLCADRRVKTITVPFTPGESWDLFGLHAVLTAFRSGFSDLGGSRLATSLATVHQLNVPASYHSSAGRGNLRHQLQRLFDAFRNNAPAVVLLDGACAGSTAIVTIAAAALHAGCTVVIACDDERVALELTSFNEVAGHVVELGPLNDQQVGELVAAATDQQPDPGLARALGAALGSLRGNPGTVLAVCELLIAQGRLTSFGGALCLAHPEAPIALPASHWLVRLVARAHEFGPALIALIADSEHFTLDDLPVFASVAECAIDECGRAIDEFTAVAALRATARGVLTVACPALARAATDAVGATRLRALHLGFARHLAAGDPELDQDLFPLADHLAAAGALAVGELGAAAVLTKAARRIRPVNATRAARWYRAALAHHPADGSAELGDLLRMLVEIGRYDWLGEVVADAIAAADAVPEELAAWACLAAIHSGVALSGAVNEVLMSHPASALPLAVTARWFTVGETVEAKELAQAFALEAREGPPLDTRGYDDDWFDPVAMFESAVGPSYRPPDRGPFVLCRQIVEHYRRGRWHAGLSAARTLLVSYPAATPVHQLARLLAAEMAARGGETYLAAEWLGEPEQTRGFPTLRSWVEIGLRRRQGDARAALESGWRACAEAVRVAEAGNTAGLHLLITRLAELAVSVGQGEGLARLGRQTTWLRRRHVGRGLGVAALIVTALADQSGTAAQAAVDALREHDRAELTTAYLAAARTAEDPLPWLRAADDLAEALGDGWLRTDIKLLARTLGVKLPRRPAEAPSTATVEARIVALIQQGKTNKQIADTIRVSVKSVERHLTGLFSKTGCRSRLDLVAAYAKLGQPHRGEAT